MVWMGMFTQSFLPADQRAERRAFWTDSQQPQASKRVQRFDHAGGGRRSAR